MVAGGAPRSVFTAALGRSATLAAASVIQAFVLILVARAAGPVEFGFYAQILSGGLVIGTLLGFGLRLQVMRVGKADAEFAFTAHVINPVVALVAATMALVAWLGSDR